MKSLLIQVCQLLPACLVLCLLNSCYVTGAADPYIVPESRQKENQYYAPSTPNAPLLQHQYDLMGGMRYSSGSNYACIEMQTAYRPGKHTGIISSYSSGDIKSSDYFKFTRYELGAGYITGINSNFQFETYGGYGGGKTTNQHYTGMSRIKNNYFFLQPAISVTNSRNTVQFAIISKFSGNHFNVTDTGFNHDREPFSASQIALLQDQSFHIFWEPGFIFRFGGQHVFFHIGYSISKDLTRNDLFRAKDNFSAGLSLQFNALQHKNK